VIAVRTHREHGAASNYARLVAYILNEAKTDGQIRISNCGDATAHEDAVALVRATQGMNVRAKGDRTYHLVVSFPPGERPGPERLRDIEEALCAAAGLRGHQRISGGHVDRGHYHFHVAVNKVHPETFRFIEPYYDQIKLNQACARLEVAHGLIRTNHGERPRQGRAGEDSLLEWIQEKAAPSALAVLDRGGSWRELHAALANFGLEIRPKRGGLVIAQDDAEEKGKTVKASSVDRRLSAKALTARLGAFEPPEAVRFGAEAPKISGPGRERAAPEAVQSGGKAVRSGGEAPRISGPSRERAAEEEDDARITAFPSTAGRDVGPDDGAFNRLLNWPKRRAAEALLMAQTPEEARRVVFSGLRSRSLGDGSTVHHVRDGGMVVEEAKRNLLRVEEVSAHAVYLSLALAEERFAGQALIVDGDAAFKSKLVKTAAERRLGVCFADPAMEEERRRLLAPLERPPILQTSAAKSRPRLAAQAQARDQEAARQYQRPHIPSAAEVYVRDQGVAHWDMPIMDRHRLWTPKDAGDASYVGARWFSDGSAAILLRKGGEVLVKPSAPGEAAEVSGWALGRKVTADEHGRLAVPDSAAPTVASSPKPVAEAPAAKRPANAEEQGRPAAAQRTPSPGSQTEPLAADLTSAAAYVSDRNARRGQIPSIEPHRLWTPEDAGEAVYNGRRRLSDNSMAILLKKGGEILVKPATAEQAAEAGRWGVGRTVAANRQGLFADGGQSKPKKKGR